MVDETDMAAAVAVAPRKRAQPKRWSAARRQKFLNTLAETSNVAASERKAKMPVGSAYRLRSQSPEFRAEWRAALREGYAKLETVMLERALSGVVRRVTKTPDGEVTEYSDRMGMVLLTAHRATVLAEDRADAGALAESAKERLARKLAEMHQRLHPEAEPEPESPADPEAIDEA